VRLWTCRGYVFPGRQSCRPSHDPPRRRRGGYFTYSLQKLALINGKMRNRWIRCLRIETPMMRWGVCEVHMAGASKLILFRLHSGATL
ncbi:hypothetical protein LINGRAHAP2_LOCUS17628, partial [Linum grandiflorum]